MLLVLGWVVAFTAAFQVAIVEAASPLAFELFHDGRTDGRNDFESTHSTRSINNWLVLLESKKSIALITVLTTSLFLDLAFSIHHNLLLHSHRHRSLD